MLTQELLEMICCPQCKADVKYDQQQNTLTCESCGTVYEIKDDIPILLPKEHGK